MPSASGADLLLKILYTVSELFDDESLLPQQRVFVQHIQNIAQPLQAPFDVVIQRDDYPWLRIPLRDAAATPVQTIVGYAKLLLERPEQFGVRTLNPQHEIGFQQMHRAGIECYNWLHELDGFENHRQWSSFPVTAFSLDELLAALTVILRYQLRDRLTLETKIFGAGHRIKANPYHVTQILQHVIFSISKEFEGVSEIETTLRQSPQAVILEFSIDTGIFDEEMMGLLFEHQGSNHFQVQLRKQGAMIQAQENTLRLSWPRLN